MSIKTVKATIQVRYGAEEDLDPDQLTTGEWAVSTDTKKVWMCFRPGLVFRMATYEGFEQDMIEIQIILATCQDIQTAVEAFEQLAERYAAQAEEWSTTSRSWAVGGTGTRDGEDINNSKYWSQQSENEANRAKEEADRAAAIAGFNVDSILSETSLDPVQNRVITKELSKKLDKTGDASETTVAFEAAKTRVDLFSKDSLSTLLGKIKKWLTDLPGTYVVGSIVTLTDFNQLNNTYRYWKIAAIDVDYAKELGIEKNTGDFYAFIVSYNGDGTSFNYGNILLTSPRLGNDYYRIQMWNAVPMVTYNRGNAPALTNNLLATIAGTALDAVQGKILNDKITQLNSDLLDTSVGIEIADPTSVHEIWAKISEPQWWAKTTIRKLTMTDANHVILNRNGYWLGIIVINSGNITGVLINHWTGEAVTIRASTYKTDSINFTTL